jgi:glutaredoxin
MSGDKILKNIPYLQGEDLTDEGNLTEKTMKIFKNRPVLVMVQGNFCGYCTDTKPDFQTLTGQNDFVCATVQIDGDSTDKEASKKINKAYDSPGVPTFLCFGRDGKFVKPHDKERTASALKESMKNL